MSKGGYLGGSTILYINSKCSSKIEHIATIPEKLFQCEICKLKFSYVEFFNHLKDKHSLKGCISCGYTYKDIGEDTHICEKCGKFIRLKQLAKQKKSKKSHELKNKDISNIIRSKSKTISNNNTTNNTIIERKAKKTDNHREENFGLSIKDLILQALAKKENS